MIISRRQLVRLLLTVPVAVCVLPVHAEKISILLDIPAFFGKSPSLLVRRFGKASLDPYDKAIQIFRKSGMEIRATVTNGKVSELSISLDKQALLPSQKWVRCFNLKLAPGSNGAKDAGASFAEWHTPLPYPAMKQIKIHGDSKGWGLIMVSDTYEPIAG